MLVGIFRHENDAILHTGNKSGPCRRNDRMSVRPINGLEFRGMGTSIPLDTLANGMLGFGHPVRLRALVLLEAETSPRDLAEALDEPLGVVSYHVRMLREYGLIEQTRTEPRRGALAHYYRRSKLGDLMVSETNGLLKVPPRKRGNPGQARRDVLTDWLSAAA